LLFFSFLLPRLSPLPHPRRSLWPIFPFTTFVQPSMRRNKRWNTRRRRRTLRRRSSRP